MNDTANTYNDDDEIELKDIYAFLKNEAQLISTIAACFSVLGSIAAFTLPVKYQAITSFQMAVVANQPVEPPSTLLEKLKQPLFYSAPTISACELSESSSSGEDLVKALNPLLSKTAPIITISYKAHSADAAKACLSHVMIDIQNQQEKIAKPLIEALKSQLSTAQEKLAIAERLKSKLAGKNFHFDFNDTKFSASALMLSTVLNKESEAKELYNQINDLTLKLAEPHTKKASTLTEIYSPASRTEPKRMLIISGGLILGMIFGVISAFIKQKTSLAKL